MFNLLKPRVMKDVKSPLGVRGRNVFAALPARVNLSYQEKKRWPWVALGQLLVVLAAFVYFVLGSVTAPTTTILAANGNADNDAERQALELQLKDLEKQIDEYGDQVTTYQKQGHSLNNEIKTLDGKISKLNLQIQAIRLNLTQLNQQIGETEYQITTTRGNIDENKKSLANILRDIYQSESTSLMEVFLKSPKISDFFNDLNDLSLLQNSLQVTIQRIADLEHQLEDQKDQLSLARADQETLKVYQESQKGETEKVKDQKHELLTVTKNQESKYQSLLKETKKTAAEIRSRIFDLLGGGELSFEDAYKFAKLAGDSTGVDP
ncbi:MAG: hypothetical protein HY093_00270, partial [Candidatus Liptonbacteria bacterium]|nr:hypothetical protein [Candidatus Liptonbacteria bacterium]